MNEAEWRLVWLSLATAFTITEILAVKSHKEHATLCHHLRQIPAGNVVVRWGLIYGTWRLHKHLYKKEVEAYG